MRPKSARPPIDHAIADLAEEQHGVVSHEQLITLGLSPSSIQRRIRSGRLIRIYARVYAVGRRLTDHRGWWKAATLTAGPGAVLSFTSAAAAWELINVRERVEVTVPSRAGRRRREGLVIHRTTLLPDHEREVRDNIPRTSVARTLLDLSTIFDRRQLERAMDEAEYLRLYDGHTLARVIADHPERASRLKRVIAEHHAGATRTNEGLEERFFLLCRRHGLPDPIVHVPIGPYEADFLWPGARLIVETDDRASHVRTAAFERDHVKTAYLQDRGYLVRRVTWRMLDRDAPGEMAAIGRLIEERGRISVA